MLWSLRKYGFYSGVLTVSCFLLIIYSQFSFLPQETGPPVQIFLQEGGKYLVDTDKCKIPNLDPWNYEVKPLYIKKTYQECSTKKKLTRIVYQTGGAYLEIDDTARSAYSDNLISCCYSNISRQSGEHPDLGIRLSPCAYFTNNVQLFEAAVLVKCKDLEGYREIYTNTHSVLAITPDVKKKLEFFNNETKPPSVLLIGIDSMSRLNFQRVFSSTTKYLNENRWLEYRGYNKIGDNTFPNLMAILTGKNLSKALDECNPREKLDECNFIWKKFSKLGYITAYAEDETSISTFNTYSYKGFRKQPADYYYMPYIMASEELEVQKLDGMSYCSGPETSAERILNIVKDMVSVFPTHPKFGFFWMNSFSHEDINAPGRLDKTFASFFKQLQSQIDKNTIIIFFSDHGIRFGRIRLTRSGWLEERLPFLYFWVPNSFKRKFPEETNYLKKNSVKLTTPYDIYMSLQHILVLSNLDHVSKPSEGCSNASSLFGFIHDRSCEDASIQMHWCTCFGYEYFDPNSKISQNASTFAVNEINSILDSSRETYNKCARYTLGRVISAGISDDNLYNKTFLLLIFETVPKAIYEITISVHMNQTKELFVNEGSASRLDRYEITSTCASEHRLYCYCCSNILMQMNFLGFWFEV